MKEEILYLSKRIRELRGIITFELNNIQISKGYITDDSLRQLEEKTFCFLSDFLSKGNENKAIIDKISHFADHLGYKLVNSMIDLDQAINFIYLIRGAIISLIETEFRNNNISIDTVFNVIKIFEPLYQLISSTLFTHYQEVFSDTKNALDVSNNDLQITLRERSELQKALNEATIFAVMDKDNQICYANDKFCNLYKYSREELTAKPHEILSSGYHSVSFFNEIWNTIERGEVWNGEILNQAKDGTKYWLATVIVPFVNSNGERYKHISIQYDITEKKETQERLVKAEKLSIIGELAAGFAHEIRNPLTAIRGFVQLLTESDQGNPYANTLLDEIERINFIVNEFMIFAKPHAIYYSECNLKSILESTIKFIEPEALLNNVSLDFYCPSEEIIILGEKNQLKQVFLNLIKNSIDAMPTGGEISITLQKKSESIVLTFKDEGNGMDSEQLSRLGEPFFTTKQEGHGLGLMVSFKIIQDHNGTIDVKSKVNQGTTFIISFKTGIQN